MRHIRRRSATPSSANRWRCAQLLRRLSRALATLEPFAETGQALATELEQRFGLNSCLLATYVESDDFVRFHVSIVAGKIAEVSAEPVSDHPFAQLIDQRELTVIPAGAHLDQSLLAFPLVFGGTTLGVLAVGPPERAKRYRHLLWAAAELLATAAYVRSQAEMLELTFTEQSSMLARVSEIAQELNATLDPAQIVEHVLLQALTVPAADAGAILMLEHDGRLALRAEQGVDPAFVAAQAAHPLSVADLGCFDLNQEYQLKAVDQLRPGLRIRGRARAEAMLRLQRDDRLIGVLLLTTDDARGFTPFQLQFLKQLVAHGALALSNAGAYAALEQQRGLLDRRLAQLQAVAYISQAISAHLNLDALLGEIVRVVRTTLGYRSALLSLVDTQAPDQVRRVAAVGIPDGEWRSLRKQVVPLGNYQTLMSEDFRISRSFYIAHDHRRASDVTLVEIVEQGYRPELGVRGSDEWNADDLLLVPLYGHRGGLVGILSVDDPADRQRPTPETVAVLEIFATQAATAIENAQMYGDLEQLALTDNLTGLANQRHFMMHLTQQVALAERHGSELALLALDIDHFKLFNDMFGHLAGNVVLQEFANILKQVVRVGDQVARWGGEEFLALLPQSTPEGAVEVAERIRQVVRSHSFPHRSVSVSIGVAVFSPGMSENDLLGAADAALYRAKAQRDAVAT